MTDTEKNLDGTRDRIQNWLMAEGWTLAEQSHPDEQKNRPFIFKGGFI